MTGRSIAGRYDLAAEIGRGGMGAVWRSTDTVLGRTVALKRIGIAPGGATPDTVRAEREARLAAQLNDPHVVSVFDLVSDGPDQWLVMEYVDGTDLAALIRDHGALSPDQVAPLLAQTAGALAAAHARGIVHRDVKPSNILVTADGQVKLSDFGIARTQADAALTQTGLVTGSPAYLSPEVASGRQATPASDVWSLGATLFHALEGRPPYDLGDNVIGGLYRIVHEEPPRPRRPGWLEPMPPGTMTREPGARWTAAQVQAFLEGGPAVAVTPRPAPRLSVVTPTPREATALLQAVAPAAPDTSPTNPDNPDNPDTPAAPPEPGVRRRSRRRPPAWLLALGAVLLVALIGVGLAIGLGHDGDGGQATGGGSSAAAGSGSSPATAEAPTAEGMTAFLTDYLQTVVTDNLAAFAMLTPDYQQTSGGLAGYRSFWGKVTATTLVSADADPDSLIIDYTYRYARTGQGSRTEQHRMQLEYADGRYLIAGQG